jgi:hypothetical protein
MRKCVFRSLFLGVLLKYILLAALALNISAASADWKTPGEIAEIRAACNVPSDAELRIRAASTLRRFLVDGDMLNTAFLVGFMQTNSRLACYGLCVIELAGKTPDPDWEPAWDVENLKRMYQCYKN